MTSDLDVLSQLLPLQWRGIEVPCAQNSVEFNHRLVPHRQYGVPGASVENTGRNEAKFAFKVFFRGGISGYHGLYPDTFRLFWTACLDPTVGELQHPEFGRLDCRLESFKLDATPERRDGYDVDCVWVETNDTGFSLASAADSPIRTAIQLASDLESFYKVVPDLPAYDDGSGMSLTENLKKIASYKNIVDIAVGDMLSDIANVINAVNNLIDAAEGATDPTKAWPVIESLKAIEAALSQLSENTGLAPIKRVAMRIAQSDMTPGMACAKFSMDLPEFFALNPACAVSGLVAKDSEIFVYESR